MKIWQIWAKPILCTSKESLEHVESRFRCKKFDFFWKNQYFQFFNFFPWCRNVKILFSIFQNFQIFFWKMASMGPIKWWMKQSHEIWAHLGHPPRNHEGSPTCAGTKCPPPCSIGLIAIQHFWKLCIFFILFGSFLFIWFILIVFGSFVSFRFFLLILNHFKTFLFLRIF